MKTLTGTILAILNLCCRAPLLTSLLYCRGCGWGRRDLESFEQGECLRKQAGRKGKDQDNNKQPEERRVTDSANEDNQLVFSMSVLFSPSLGAAHLRLRRIL